MLSSADVDTTQTAQSVSRGKQQFLHALLKFYLLQMQLYAWGWGRYGNLGDGEKTDR